MLRVLNEPLRSVTLKRSRAAGGCRRESGAELWLNLVRKTTTSRRRRSGRGSGSKEAEKKRRPILLVKSGDVDGRSCQMDQHHEVDGGGGGRRAREGFCLHA